MKRFIHGANWPPVMHGGTTRTRLSHQRRVSTHNETAEHVGLVLPPAAPKHISIKLDNGYNVSYPAEAVQDWEELEPIQPSVGGDLHSPAEDESLLGFD